MTVQSTTSDTGFVTKFFAETQVRRAMKNKNSNYFYEKTLRKQVCVAHCYPLPHIVILCLTDSIMFTWKLESWVQVQITVSSWHSHSSRLQMLSRPLYTEDSATIRISVRMPRMLHWLAMLTSGCAHDPLGHSSPITLSSLVISLGLFNCYYSN